MIRVTTFPGKKVAVFGLGASGLASARALAAGGAEVAAWDDGEAGRAAAAKEGIPLVDLRSLDWTGLAALVLAPGVPLTHPEPHWTVRKAEAAGVPVIGDVELFARERAKIAPDAPFIGITGTNGKSTTTALVAHLLRELGCAVEMGGNIGTAILSLEPPARERVHVIELSSYQIDLTPTLKPTVGVLMNVTPDHIDRHGTLERYAAVKERLVVGAEAAALGVDDDITRAIAARFPDPGRLYPFTAGGGTSVVPRVYAIGPTLFIHEQEGAYASSREIASLEGIATLRGQHNAQNAAGALAALRALQDRLDAHGIPARVWRPEALQAALRSFEGLPHRLEVIGRRGTVDFINDSKATNADSAEKALASFPGSIYWIIGGRPKEGGITPLVSYFPRVAKAYLIGEATEEFAATLGDKVAFERCGTLDVAVQRAAADALAANKPGSVVLLSPACASFDQYRNFEIRGDHFRRLASEIIAAGPDP